MICGKVSTLEKIVQLTGGDSKNTRFLAMLVSLVFGSLVSYGVVITQAIAIAR